MVGCEPGFLALGVLCYGGSFHSTAPGGVPQAAPEAWDSPGHLCIAGGVVIQQAANRLGPCRCTLAGHSGMSLAPMATHLSQLPAKARGHRAWECAPHRPRSLCFASDSHLDGDAASSTCPQSHG